jgi:hypothetical protein
MEVETNDKCIIIIASAGDEKATEHVTFRVNLLNLGSCKILGYKGQLRTLFS